MKAALFYITAILFILGSPSCQKKPSASFSTSKEVYSTAETIETSNTSSNGGFYSWVVKGPNNYEQRGSAIDFSFRPEAPGDYDISLVVYSKNGQVSSSTSKRISCTAALSSYIFFTEDLDGFSYKDVSIYIDNLYIGKITNNCFYTPSCGDPKGVTTLIAPGVHDIRFTFSPYNLNKNIYGATINYNSGCGTWKIIP